MKHLAPALSSAKVNVPELERLRATLTQLQLRGIYPEGSVANFPLLTAKIAPKDVAALKKSFPRQGFVGEIEALEREAKEFAAEFSGKGAAAPSQAWKLLYSAKPEAVLWTAHAAKGAAMQAKFNSFYNDWPQARQRLPHTMMQEMRIVPSLPGYDDLLDKLFFELMDSKLGTEEEMKAYLEPYSPPAPPPPVHLRRARVAKKDAKPAKSRKKAAVEVEAGAEAAAETEVAAAAKPVKAAAKKAALAKPAKVAAKKAPAAAKKTTQPAKAAAKKAAPPAKKAKAPVKKTAAKKLPVKAAAKKAAPSTKKPKAPVKKAATKKVPAKAVSKKAPAKGSKPVAKKVVAPVKKPVAKKPAVASGKKKK
jgi:hypothetical protein